MMDMARRWGPPCHWAVVLSRSPAPSQSPIELSRPAGPGRRANGAGAAPGLRALPRTSHLPSATTAQASAATVAHWQ